MLPVECLARPTSLNYEGNNKHLQPLTPGLVFGQIEKLGTEPNKVAVSRAYDDGEIYANVGPIYENIRLKHEVAQCQDRCRLLEEDNSALREDNEKKSKIIDNFKIQNTELESEVAELRKLGNFENNHKPALPTASPLQACAPPPSPGPRSSPPLQARAPLPSPGPRSSPLSRPSLLPPSPGPRPSPTNKPINQQVTQRK